MDFYKCSECFELFTTEENLWLHEAKHTENIVPEARPSFEVDDFFRKSPDILKNDENASKSEHLEKVDKEAERNIPTKKDCIPEKVKSQANKPAEKLKKEEHKRKKKNKWTTEEKVVKTSDGKYACAVCDKVFKSKKHVLIHHNVHIDILLDTKPYKCETCNKGFRHVDTLKQHILTHGIDTFGCPECSKVFYIKNRLEKHMLIHNKVKPYLCQYCPKGFTSTSAMKRHVRTHTGEKPYACPYCPKRFSDFSAFKVHKMRHDGIKNFPCTKCDQSFYTTTDLGRHMKKHTKERNFECNICSKGYVSKPSLRLHIERMHNKVKKKYACLLCPIKSHSKSVISKHVAAVHAKSKQYVCDKCRMEFPLKERLDNHKMIWHMDEYNLQCAHCCCQYKIKASLKKHILRCHTGLQCSICLEYYPNNTTLIKHKMKCNKPAIRKAPVEHPCPQCNIKFSKKTHLKRHSVRTHPREPPPIFECDLCGKIFKRKPNLVKHFRLAHTVECQICKKLFDDILTLEHHNLRCKLKEWIKF